MTNRTFDRVWGGVNYPPYRGATCPDFEPSMINCSEIEYALRPKEYGFAIKNGVLEIDWVSQGWCDPDSLVKEIRRCMLHIGFIGEVRMKIRQRGASLYGECGARRRFIIRPRKETKQ